MVILTTSGTVVYTSECDTTNTAGTTTHPTTAVCERRSGRPRDEWPRFRTRSPADRGAARVSAGAHDHRRELRRPPPVAHRGSRASSSRAADYRRSTSRCRSTTSRRARTRHSAWSCTALRCRSSSSASARSSATRRSSSELEPAVSVIRYTGSYLHPGYCACPCSRRPAALRYNATSAASSIAAHAIYTVPGIGAVAGSFEPLTAPGGTTVAGYIGVEVPVALFAAATAQDEGTIAEIAITALIRRQRAGAALRRSIRAPPGVAPRTRRGTDRRG